MALATYPAVASPVKLVQRGQAVSAGTITITAVDTTKTFVRSFSEGSAGSVAAAGSITGTLSPAGGSVRGGGGGNYGANNVVTGSFASYSGTRTLAGGTTDVTAKQMGVYLTGSTTLVATGACRWEVVEYN